MLEKNMASHGSGGEVDGNASDLTQSASDDEDRAEPLDGLLICRSEELSDNDSDSASSNSEDESGGEAAAEGGGGGGDGRGGRVEERRSKAKK